LWIAVGYRFRSVPHAANHHEVRLVQLCFDFYMIEAKPQSPQPIADREPL
jgi:hypothetical protein